MNFRGMLNGGGGKAAQKVTSCIIPFWKDKTKKTSMIASGYSGGHKEEALGIFFSIMKLLCILIVIMVIQVFIFVKIHKPYPKRQFYYVNLGKKC